VLAHSNAIICQKRHTSTTELNFQTPSEGFTLTLCGLKALLEHNVILDLARDRFPTDSKGINRLSVSSGNHCNSVTAHRSIPVVGNAGNEAIELTPPNVI
jgi:hypothetical protein